MTVAEPTTPAKKTPGQIMEETRKRILSEAGFSLLVGHEAQIGMVMKPVKIETVDFNGLRFAGEKQSTASADAAGDVAQNALKLLQGKIVAETEVSTGFKTIENGPYIQMPLPEKIKDALKVNYSNADMSQFVVGLSLGQDVKELLSGKGNSEAVRAAAIGSASFAIRTIINGLGSGVAAIAQKKAGNIPNPFSTAIFERVTPRSFSFSWTIQPKSVDESETLKEVINVLRYYSLPNPSKNRLLLAVPYEWVLSFTGTNFLYSFSRCVMTDLDIDYSPNGMNVFMKDTRAPQAVTITVGFQEIYPLDKQIIDDKDTINSMTPINTIPREEDPPVVETASSIDAKVDAANAAKRTAEIKKAEDELAKAKEEKKQAAAAAVVAATAGGEIPNFQPDPKIQERINKADKAVNDAENNLAAAKELPGG